MVLDRVEYSGKDLHTLMFNTIEPKIQAIVSTVLQADYKAFSALVAVPSAKLQAAQLFFRDVLLKYREIMDQETAPKRNEVKVVRLCKDILGYDLISSEVVRIASLLTLNQQFV